MSQYRISDTLINGIASAIKEKTGTSGTIAASNMPTLIRSISGGGGSGFPFNYKTGTITVTEDIGLATYGNITHNLGEVPQICLLWCVEQNYTTGDATGRLITASAFHQKGGIYSAVIGRKYANVNGAPANTTATMDSTVFAFPNDGNVLTAGYTYKWIAIGSVVTPTNPQTEPTLTVSTFNIAGFGTGNYNGNGTDEQIAQYLALFNDMDADIVGLQEDKLKYNADTNTDDVIYDVLYDYKYRASGSGVPSIVSKYELTNKTTTKYTDETAYMYVEGTVNIDGTDVTIISTHTSFRPTTQIDVCHNELIAHLATLDNFILMGDMNPWGSDHHYWDTVYKMYTDAGYNVASCGAYQPQLTFHAGSDYDNVWVPCDNIITSANIKIDSVRTITTDLSDHKPIVAELRITNDNTQMPIVYNPSSTTNYTLTFDVDGGTSISSVTQASGTVIQLSSYTTTKSGYTFEGWYSESAKQNKITSVTLSENKTVYANWTAASSGDDSSTIEWDGTTNTLPTNITVDGTYSLTSNGSGGYNLTATDGMVKIWFPSSFAGAGTEMEVAFTINKGTNATWEHGFMLLNGANSSTSKNSFTDAHVQNNKMWFGTTGSGDYVATYDDGDHTLKLVSTGQLTGYSVFDGVQKPQAVRETTDASSYFWFKPNTIAIKSFKITKPTS